MTNVERACLLAGLFPKELPGVLQDIRDRATYLREHEDNIRKEWDNGLITAEFWFDLAKRVHGAVEKYDKKLLKSRRLFADQLFDGHNALFTIDCIAKYAKKGNGSARFRLAVDMLFEHHP
ncbi:hypothetical protein MKP05_21565 [Halomonas sp. EGI 63088]|uniref:Uncharacterized protein n=2 Tax=Pseudomonadati TaxID=3379134 RepID=A0ABS9S0Q8_9GAMM|nr:hypothetical protein [Halomonas flagellata]MCH4565672.1 hypothetical protein [Halomonas flagellata]